MDRSTSREGRPSLDQRTQSISVKSLIRSIEEQVKSGCSSIHSSHSESRRSSTSSDISLTSLKELVKSPSSPLPDSPKSPTKEFSLKPHSFRSKPDDRSPQDKDAQVLSPEGLNKSCSRGEEGKMTQISSILKDRGTPRRGSTVV